MVRVRRVEYGPVRDDDVKCKWVGISLGLEEDDGMLTHSRLELDPHIYAWTVRTADGGCCIDMSVTR